MRECNKCSNRKCDRMRLHRSGKRKLSVEEMQSSCPRWKPVSMYKEKVIMLCIDKNPQAVHDVLQAHGMRLQELADRPYFKITLTDKRKRKRGNRRNRKRPYRNQGNVGDTPVSVQYTGSRTIVA